MKHLLKPIVSALIAGLLFVSCNAYAETCKTDCYTDMSGNQHCTTTCY